jgi:TPR repeat protein
MTRRILAAIGPVWLLCVTAPALATEAPKIDPLRFGATQVNPSRFGDKPAEPDSLPTPLTILKAKKIDPGSVETPAPVADQGIDLKRFGGKPPDEAYGAFQRGLYMTAYNLALPRAEKGDPHAQALVAELLTRGLGVKLDPSAAAGWYEKAAQQGVTDAQFQVALLKLDGKYVARDRTGAIALMKTAAESGNPLAQFNLAQLYIEEQPGETGLKAALPYLRTAAATGLPDAQYAMAQFYANGAAGVKADAAEARRYLIEAARQGYDTAQLDLGTALVEAKTQAEQRDGFAWLLRAATQGNVAAMNRVAKLYMQGIGVNPDPVEAAAWYKLASKAGLNDLEMQDYLDGLSEEQMAKAGERATLLR